MPPSCRRVCSAWPLEAALPLNRTSHGWQAPLTQMKPAPHRQTPPQPSSPHVPAQFGVQTQAPLVAPRLMSFFFFFPAASIVWPSRQSVVFYFFFFFSAKAGVLSERVEAKSPATRGRMTRREGLSVSMRASVSNRLASTRVSFAHWPFDAIVPEVGRVSIRKITDFLREHGRAGDRWQTVDWCTPTSQGQHSRACRNVQRSDPVVE